MRRAIAMMTMTTLAGCEYLPLDEVFDDETSPQGLATTVPLVLPPDGLWALVHPTDAPPEGPGIVHVDAAGAELARLPLPEGVTSPHGLAYDGVSLWMTE